MYKQWHISGVGNLKVCTSATAHTQTVISSPCPLSTRSVPPLRFPEQRNSDRHTTTEQRCKRFASAR